MIASSAPSALQQPPAGAGRDAAARFHFQWSRVVTATLFALAVAGLVGCQVPVPRDVDNPYYVVPVDSTLVLRRALEVPLDTRDLYFQKGRMIRLWYFEMGRLNRYEAHCKLDFVKSDYARLIEPDEFEVYRVERETTTSQGPPAPIQVASAGALQLARTSASARYMTTMYLRSRKQPGIKSMTCQRWEDAAAQGHISVNTIRDTLKPLFLLELPEEAS